MVRDFIVQFLPLRQRLLNGLLGEEMLAQAGFGGEFCQSHLLRAQFVEAG